MINAFVFEGIVDNIWRYSVVLLFRLACYRHSNLPPKPLNDLQDATGIVTLQKPHSKLAAWMYCFLHSLDYEGSLADFLKDARGAELPVPESLDPSDLRAPRGTTEVVARRIMSQVNGSKR